MSFVENAVLLHYVGHYYCEADVGHVCDDADNSTSIIRNSAATCVADRVYILAADGEDGVICVHTSKIKEIYIYFCLCKYEDTSQAHADIQTLAPMHSVHSHLYRIVKKRCRQTHNKPKCAV